MRNGRWAKVLRFAVAVLSVLWALKYMTLTVY